MAIPTHRAVACQPLARLLKWVTLPSLNVRVHKANGFILDPPVFWVRDWIKGAESRSIRGVIRDRKRDDQS